MQQHAWGICLKLSRRLLPEHLSPKVSLQLSVLCLSVLTSHVHSELVDACELQAATCFQPYTLSPVRQLHTPGSSQAQQPWRICLPLSELRSTETPRSAAAMAAAANDATVSKAPNVQAAVVNASNVRAAFAEAGLSQAAVNHIVRQYPHYLRWRVEDKLLPAIQSWQQELGASFLSELKRVPELLLRRPAEELLKHKYLVSIGIQSLARLRKKNACVFRQSLTSLQNRVAFLQQWGFTTAQTLSLIEKHPDVLHRTSEHIAQLLRLVEDMFDCADRQTLCDVILSCDIIGLCSKSAKDLHRNFTYFCTCVDVDHQQMKRAWKYGVFKVSPVDLDIRLSFIAAQLSATMNESCGAQHANCSCPSARDSGTACHTTAWSWIRPWPGQEYVFAAACPAGIQLQFRCACSKMGILDSYFATRPQCCCCPSTPAHTVTAKQTWAPLGVLAATEVAWRN